MTARSTDNKDRWILALDETTGKTRVIEHDHDDAWLDGPERKTLGWMKSDRDIYFQMRARRLLPSLHGFVSKAASPSADHAAIGKWSGGSFRKTDRSSTSPPTRSTRGNSRSIEMSAEAARERAHTGIRRSHLRSVSRRKMDGGHLFIYEQAARAVCAGNSRWRDGEEADLVAGDRFLRISLARTLRS